ncbi:ParB/RepB/Spo0J family partition protein [Rarobacter faecitabidus]|uniref:Chromosome segregation DNA-binding protein n=1 Tax=Rarobacter faecitabidus TaxID=13243 RepID=A0A542ZPC5_RARFA|nr:ParB/RepB/Spo0J family partition protein [Rarobacter faecitabidus]TQL62215.1 chromosome segregation DNA-binding protein [Rarobacter faecitabidus]
MSQKRRGLGKGLGALIPTGPTATRPSDVFFGPGNGQGETSAKTDGSAGQGHQNTDASGRRGTDSELSAKTAETTVQALESISDPAGEAGALSSAPASDDLLPVPGASFAEIPTAAIRPNSRQPRTVFDEDDLTELTASIAEVGVLQPIVVRIDPSGDGSTYELIMGERRWRATQAAGLERIPAIIRETEEGDLLRDALLENLHRAALNPLEEAAAYQQLLDDFGCTQEELSTRIARSRPQISNTLRLLKLPPLVQRRVAAGVISAGHARALLRLSDAAGMERLAQRIVAEGLSVRATEEIAALGGVPEDPAPKVRPRPGTRVEAIDELATRLADRLDTRVKIALGKRKGRITVEFGSVEDLNRILTVIAPDEQGLFQKRS